jgi:hypothetical protein
MKHELLESLIKLIGDIAQGQANARITEDTKEADSADKVRLLKVMGLAILIWVVLISIYLHFQKL